MASHSPLLVTLMVVNFVAYLFNLLMGLMSRVDTEKYIGFDLLKTSFSDDGHYIEITPTPQTFIIWGPIYIWQAVWMFYGFACICRRAPDGPVYTSPTLLTPTFYCISTLNWGCVITWYVLATYDYTWAAFVVLAAIFITTYICIGLSYMTIAGHSDTLVKQNRKREIWMIRGMVHNGLAFYAAWCTIATLLNLTEALSYDVHPQFNQSTSSTIALSILAVELVLFVVMDWIVLEKHTRYTFSPYIVVIVALSGSIVRNWNPLKTNSIFTAVLLAAASLAFIVKMILMFLRHFRDSRRDEEILPTTETKQMRRL